MSDNIANNQKTVDSEIHDPFAGSSPSAPVSPQAASQMSDYQVPPVSSPTASNAGTSGIARPHLRIKSPTPPDADMYREVSPVEEQQVSALRKVSAKVLSILALIITALILAYVVRAFVLTPYEIPSASMENTIEPNDTVMTERVSYYFGQPQYSDIVTFSDPELSNRTLIKRVIATPGQEVDIRLGDVYIDGEKLDEPYLKEPNSTFPLAEQMEGIEEITYPYVVPDGCVWVMGDNRGNSEDSRYFGAVPIDTVYGKAFFRYWPIDRIGGLE